MKVGSLVMIVGSHARVFGTVISPWKVDEWWEILTERGQIIHWPESQLEVISDR